MLLCDNKESYRRFKDQHTLTTCVEHVIVLSGSRVSCVSRPRSMLTMGATLADAMQSITTLSSSSSTSSSSSMSTTSSRYAASFARFSYPSLVKLSEHMKSIGEVAVARTANWQRFCAHNVDTMLVLAELALILNEDTASGSTIVPSVLQLLLLCVTSKQQSAAAAAAVAAAASSSSVTAAQPKHEDTTCVLLVNAMLRQVGRDKFAHLVRTFLIEHPLATTRWTIHSLLANMFKVSLNAAVVNSNSSSSSSSLATSSSPTGLTCFSHSTC